MFGTKKKSKERFPHLNDGDAALDFLVSNFPASSKTSWKFKRMDDINGGATIRSYSGPMGLSAAVIYNPNAEEEPCALILDTSGNYEPSKYDASKFVNRNKTEKEL